MVRKNTKNGICIFFCLLIAVFMTNCVFCGLSNNCNAQNIVYATESDLHKINEEYKGLDYVIDSLDVVVNVSEQNILSITETYNVFFNEPRHGIYRVIPIVNKIKREDGTTSKVYAKISDIKCNENFELEIFDNNKRLQIGNADTTIIGQKTYILSYTYDLGPDTLNGADEFYYNIVGSNWDTVFGEIHFKVNFPKSFDSSLLGFSYAKNGVSTPGGVEYIVEGNSVIGTFTGILGTHSALTMRLTLQDGYFVNVKESVNLLYIIFPSVLIVLSIILYLRFGRGKSIIPVVNFYPPKNLNPLEMALIHKKAVGDKDISSLVVYLASKGYIKIEETEKEKSGKLSKQKNIILTKLKDADMQDINEKKFMTELFKNGDTVGINDLTKGDFYKDAIFPISKDMNSKIKKDKYYKKCGLLKSIFIMFAIISLFLISFPSIEYFGVGMLSGIIIAIVSYGIAFIVFNASFSGYGVSQKAQNGLMIGLMLLGSLICVLTPTGQLVMQKFPLIIVFNIVAIIVFVILYCITNPMTDEGSLIYGEVKGFKNFLVTCEKDRLEKLVEDDPAYFYNILPFAYVLGVSDKWIKKFETIAIPNVDWFICGDNLTTYLVATAIYNSMRDVTKSVNKSHAYYSSTNSSTGGFSGGGFSGGGVGGGGGGSW